MAGRIEDYALIGDGRTAALVGRDGSIDWLCWPRFDASALFAALLGTREHGFWTIAPVAPHAQHAWRYRDGTLILESTYRTHEGVARVTDFMPAGDGSHLIRLVDGVSGRMAMRMELSVRFDYGSAVPWVSRSELGDLRAIAGPHKVVLRTNAELRGSEHQTTCSDFTIHEGETKRFVLSYGPSHEDDPHPIEPLKVLQRTDRAWRDWSDRCTSDVLWPDIFKRSLVTLKALIYEPTGGIVAAPTTSLPEAIGGVRNWDYRFCWLRDSAFTLSALMDSGYIDEARAWRDWLQRAVAGNPEQAHILYGIAGERLLPEIEIDWLPGYEGSRPVRVGNAAMSQFQLDVYGELFDAMYQARVRGLPVDKESWRVGQALMKHLDSVWREPDEGIWEVRGGRKHFVHSKVMAWVAYDRAIRSWHHFTKLGHGLGDAPIGRWKVSRDEIHAEVCTKGFDAELNSFVQYYGAKTLDASVLLMAHVGFLPQDDPRVIGTVDAIGRRLLRDGFILRYDTEDGQDTDGLPAGEGAFLPCSFWYADNLIGLGRQQEAEALIERLIGICNDLGLVSEEYDPVAKRQVGNFPQAFTHVALVNTILNYSRAYGTLKERVSSTDDSPDVADDTATNDKPAPTVQAH